MTITYINFAPTATATFQFQATFDGNGYTVEVQWNLFGQRWYILITALDGTLVVCEPMVGSPVGGPDINLAAPYFTTTTLVWRTANNQLELSNP